MINGKAFRQSFVSQRFASGYDAASLGELFEEWHDLREREAIYAAIRRGLHDIEQRRFEPADDFNRVLIQKLGLSEL